MSSLLESAVAEMVAGVRNREKTAFALPENRFYKAKRKADELASRRHIKRMVRPENAAGLFENLPPPGECTHAILRGDFVLGQALPALLQRTGYCFHLRISTLALSVANAETLSRLIPSPVGKLTLLCSHYFRAVDKTSTFHAVTSLLSDIATLKVARCHAKIMLVPTELGSFVFEGSANLRSSDTIEQLTIFNDPELLAFHASWMDELISQEAKP